MPKPFRNGDSISIKISEDEYQKGLDSCKNNLHGRFLLPKGSAPIKFQDLKSKLAKLWKPLGSWHMIPLGRGYYEFIFSSAEDLRCAWAVGSWNMNPGILRLYQWSPDFNPNKLKQSHAQVWLRIVYLPMEYWRPKILFEIASGIGTPLSLDEATKSKIFGHYARILVDVGLCNQLPNEIMVERNEYAFYVNIVYEKLPLFCDFCKSIGHNEGQCKKEGLDVKKPVLQKDRDLNPRQASMVYVPKHPATANDEQVEEDLRNNDYSKEKLVEDSLVGKEVLQDHDMDQESNHPKDFKNASENHLEMVGQNDDKLQKKDIVQNDKSVDHPKDSLENQVSLDEDAASC